MSAIPKKKLCWNCEGNVLKEVESCPYCGVYLQATEIEGGIYWNPSRQTSKTEEIPSPLYQVPQEDSLKEESEESLSHPSEKVLNQFKQDILPLLALMAGSVFFLFSILLLLFSQDGKLTLQWNGDYWPIFLTLSLPCLYIGWRSFQRLDLH